MNRNAGLRHGLFSGPLIHRAVPEAGAPVRSGSWPRFASKFWRFSLPMNLVGRRKEAHFSAQQSEPPSRR
jgi:hypothetical protein